MIDIYGHTGNPAGTSTWGRSEVQKPMYSFPSFGVRTPMELEV
jgi:hypothetical protein